MYLFGHIQDFKGDHDGFHNLAYKKNLRQLYV